jgi:hypothetical protein
LNCTICQAPATPLDGTCVFCHTPIGDEDDPVGLFEYLAEKIPIAKVKRGHLNRGPITELTVDAGGRSFKMYLKKEALVVEPPVHLTAWVDLLLTRLSDAAAVDADLRRSFFRSGWALR